MGSKRLIILGMIFMFLILPPLTGDAASAAAGPEGSARNGGNTAPQMKIALRGGLLFLDLRDVEIGAVLRAIAEKAGIGLTVGDGVRGRVSLTLEGVSLEEALRRLCASRAILYEYDPETRIGRIIGAGAFAESSGPPAGARPDAAVPDPVAATAAGKISKEGAVHTKDGLPPPPGGSPPGGYGGERLYDSQGRLLYKPGELLVRFRPEATMGQIAALHRSLGSALLKSLDNIKLHRVRLREGLSEREGIVLYRAAEIVAVAERHALRYPMLTPDDPYYASDSQWGMNKIQMPDAWDKTTGNADIVIGVIDTGVDTKHPDLAANLLPGRDLAGDSGSDRDDWDSIPMDKSGHGTHVAGIIAAVGNNNRGVAGVGWNLRIMPLKVVADNTSQDMETFDIVAAIDYAIAQRVRIVNCSFGGSVPSREEYMAFESLRQAGILAACAAGNGIDNTYPAVDLDTSIKKNYPASYAHQPYTDDQGAIHQALDNIISVAASLEPKPNAYPPKPENLWAGSNYGQNSVDLMAPGENIYSTHLCLGSVECNSYMSRQGTSMAAPHVSGVAGLILSLRPQLGYASVKKILLENVDKIAEVSNLLVSGGRLNALNALSQTCYPGEVTGGAGIGLPDVIAALRIASGLDAGVPLCRTADVDGDGRIGLAEAIYGLQILSLLRDE